MIDMATLRWAVCVEGREEDGLRCGSTREEAIEEALVEETERRECAGEEARPIGMTVYGGCVWEVVPEDERSDDEPWAYRLGDWSSCENLLDVEGVVEEGSP